MKVKMTGSDSSAVLTLTPENDQEQSQLSQLLHARIDIVTVRSDYDTHPDVRVWLGHRSQSIG